MKDEGRWVSTVSRVYAGGQQMTLMCAVGVHSSRLRREVCICGGGMNPHGPFLLGPTDHHCWHGGHCYHL